MAKKKITEEQAVEAVVEETTVPVEAEALPEITEDNVSKEKEAPVKKTTKKRSTKKKVEVPAEEVVAVDDNGDTAPLTDVVPETKGEIVAVDTEVAQSFIDDVSAVEEVLPEKVEADKPIEVKVTKKSAAKKTTTKKPTAKKPAQKEAKTEFTIEKPVWCYPNAVAPKAIKTISGKVYLWDNNPSVGRYAVTDKADGAGRLSALCGWVKAEDLGL